MIVIIPARGGSKRIPKKNISLLLGKPLIEYTLDAVLAAKLNCPIYVSTEDESVIEVVSKFHDIGIIKRPHSLASDDTSTESVLIHALDQLQSDSHEWIMTLPPTSPFRHPDTIKKFIDSINEQPDSQDCLMSTTENYGDFWQLQEDGAITRLFPDAPRRQQERSPLLEENSAIYLTRISALRDTGSILGNRVRSINISAIEGFDINTPEDLEIAEKIAASVFKL